MTSSAKFRSKLRQVQTVPPTLGSLNGDEVFGQVQRLLRAKRKKSRRAKLPKEKANVRRPEKNLKNQGPLVGLEGIYKGLMKT